MEAARRPPEQTDGQLEKSCRRLLIADEFHITAVTVKRKLILLLRNLCKRDLLAGYVNMTSAV